MTDWFLRPINPAPEDAWCFQVIPAGAIRIHYSNKRYFRRLAMLISQTDGNGDEVFFVGWEFNLSINIRDEKSVLTWLQAARGRHNTRVRLLLSGNKQNERQQLLAARGDPKGNGKIEAIIDDQLDADTTHHQKAAFVKTRATSHLLIGGMDVTSRRIGFVFDVQAEVMGPAADLGRITLEERWDSVTRTTRGTRATVIPRGDKPQHHVQFVRTYSPVGKVPPASTRNFAEKGEHTYYELLKKAIGLAKRSIYLEEQFLWSTGVVPGKTAKSATDPARRSDISDFPALLEDLLLQAINRDVKVIIVGPNFDADADQPFKKSREAVVNKLRKAKTSAESAPVFLKLHPNAVFVRSKAWIFDDEFVVIGSAQFWEKSLVSVRLPAQSEFGMAFTSEVSGKALGIDKATFARALRLKLWERFRRAFDYNYRFPFKEGASINDELTELRSTIIGKQPFADMP